MASLEPDRKVSKKARLASHETVLSSADTVAARLSRARDAIRVRPGRHFVVSPGPRWWAASRLIGADQPLPSTSSSSQTTTVKTWITTTLFWWDPLAPPIPVPELAHLVIHCNGGLPSFTTQTKIEDFKDEPEAIVDVPFRMPSHHASLQVTVYTTVHTSVQELTLLVASLPQTYRLFHLVGPLPDTIPLCIRSSAVVFWNTTRPAALRTWIRACGQRFHHVAIRWDPREAIMPDMPDDLLWVCQVRHSVYVYTPATAETSVQPVHTLARFQFATDLRVLGLGSVALTHQLLLSVAYRNTAFPPHLRCLMLQLRPYDSETESRRIWIQHWSGLVRRLAVIDSRYLEVFLQVPVECLDWIATMVNVLMTEVFCPTKPRKGRVVVSSLQPAPDGAQWTAEVLTTCPRPLVELEVLPVPLEHDLPTLLPFFETFTPSAES